MGNANGAKTFKNKITMENLFYDRSFYRTLQEYVPYEKEVTVTEKRAPTDESIKIFNELTEKARKNIVDTVHVNENSLKGCVIVYQTEYPSIDKIFHCKFNLNGKDYTFQERISGFDVFTKETLVRFLYKKFSETITQKIIEESHEFLQTLKLR